MTENQIKYRKEIKQRKTQNLKEMNPDLIIFNYVNTKSKAEI